MKLLIKLIAAAAALVPSVPATAATFEFFEGNNCKQAKLGGINTADHIDKGQDSITILYRGLSLGRATGIGVGWNDEARSVLITTNFRDTREPRTALLTIYDDPQALKDKHSSDDWARIVVTDATQIPFDGVCIGSFERNFARDGVHLERHPNNGLDGKISLIVSACAQACRTQLTPDPNPVRPHLVVGGRRGSNDKPLSAEAVRILKKRQ